MPKNHKHQKQLKSEKAKVKLKTKGSKQLPKGLNITDTNFKVKKIIIREQLKHQDVTQILSRRKLNVKV
jgi:pre-rRNA-processing protein IPI1